MAAMADSRRRRRILLLTSPERGQVNVFLATAHALLELGAELHFASLPSIKRDVEEKLPGAIFHQLRGPEMKECWETTGTDKLPGGGEWRPPNFWNMAAFLRMCLFSLHPWSEAQFVEIFRSVTETLKTVDADITVVDPSFSPALTACRASRRRFAALSPNTIKEFALHSQPAYDIFFRFPCLPSGIPYPIPWYLMPLNAWYVLLAITLAIFDTQRFKMEQYVKAETGADIAGLYQIAVDPPPGVKLLVANLRELDYPLKTIPSHIVPCGPMVLPAPPVAETDPELAQWLDRGPTLYINLGTLVKTSLEGAETTSAAIRHALDAVAQDPEESLKRLQVLWKLEGLDFDPKDTSVFQASLGDELANGTVRLVDWLKPQPSAVLAHPNIVAFVNHGGANSFLEGVVAAKPQVVLPAWMDCFDFANRVELLGNGLWANKRTRFGLEVEDLAAALVEVLLGPRARAIRAKAEELAAICNKIPGRILAAKTILAETEVQAVRPRDVQEGTKG